MQTCPHCGIEIILKEIPYQGMFDSFKICPDCGGEFTVDSDTKYRQAIFLFISLFSLVFTVLWYFYGVNWLIPSLISYVVWGMFLYWGNKKLFLVPYEKDKNYNNG